MRRRLGPIIKRLRQQLMPSFQPLEQHLSTMPVNQFKGRAPIIRKHTAGDVARNGGQIARLVKVETQTRRACLAMRRIGFPNRLVFIWFALQTR